jgi:hypothetical protein
MMRSCLVYIGFVATFTTTSALDFTSPSEGSDIDPTRDITITWTSSSSDPSTIDLTIGNAQPNQATTELTLGSDIDTSSNTFTIPANTIQNWGTGYQIQALDGTAVLAEITDLVLSPFSGQVSTNTAGQLTIISQQSTAQGPITAPTSLQSATGVTLLSGTVTPEPTESSRRTGFITSSTSRSTEASAAASSAANTNTANGQVQMRGSEVVLGAAGVLAGIVALLA